MDIAENSLETIFKNWDLGYWGWGEDGDFPWRQFFATGFELTTFCSYGKPLSRIIVNVSFFATGFELTTFCSYGKPLSRIIVNVSFFRDWSWTYDPLFYQQITVPINVNSVNIPGLKLSSNW